MDVYRLKKKLAHKLSTAGFLLKKKSKILHNLQYVPRHLVFEMHVTVKLGTVLNYVCHVATCSVDKEEDGLATDVGSADSCMDPITGQEVLKGP